MRLPDFRATPGQGRLAPAACRLQRPRAGMMAR